MFNIKIFIQNNRHKLLLIIILILGAFLRLYDLGAESLWYDEVASIDQALEDFPTLFSGFHISPLYFLFLKYWIMFFGVSEFALRLPSAIFGILSIISLYVIGSQLFNKKVAIISSFILAISPFHIFYSQETRNYNLFVFLTLLSMVYFVRIIKEKCPSVRLFILYVITNIFLLYSMLFGLFVIVIQNIFYFSLNIKKKNKWIITQIFILLVYLIWFIPFVIFLFNEKAYVSQCIDWIPLPSLFSIVKLFESFSYKGHCFGGWDFFVNTKDIGFSWLLLYIYGIFFIIGIVFSKKNEIKYVVLSLLWLFIPITVVYLFSYLCFPLFVIRYFIFASPAYYILIAKGIERINISLYQIAAIILISLLIFPSIYFYYTKNMKIDWKKAIPYIDQNMRENDLILITIPDKVLMFNYYGKDGAKYQNKKNIKIDVRRKLGIDMLRGGYVWNYRNHELWGAYNAKQIKEIISKKGNKIDGNLWLILVTRWTQNAKEITNCIESFLERKSEKKYEGLNIYYYIK